MNCCFVSATALASLDIRHGEDIAISLSEEYHEGTEDIILTALSCTEIDFDTDREEIITLSPITLHNMKLFNIFQKPMYIWIYKPRNILLREASSVTLSRISGYEYPKDEIEKKLLLQYFSNSQNVTLGSIICVSTVDMCSSSESKSLIAEKSYLQLYYVKEIILTVLKTDNNNSNMNNNDNISDMESHDNNSSSRKFSLNYSECSASSSLNSGTKDSNLISNIIPYLSLLYRPNVTVTITVKGVTTLGLKGRTNCIVPNLKYLEDYIDRTKIRIKTQKNLKNQKIQNNHSRPWTLLRNLLEPSVVDLSEALSPVLHLAFSAIREENVNSGRYDYFRSNSNYSSNNDSNTTNRRYKNILTNSSHSNNSYNSNDNDRNNDRNNNENRSRDNRYNWKRNDQDSHSSDTHYSVNDHALFNIIKSPQLVENPTGEEGGTLDLDSSYIIIMYYLT